MAELVAKVGETNLLRTRMTGSDQACANRECPVEPPVGYVYVYWFSEDQGVPPPNDQPAYCSYECWAANQCGPRPLGRPRQWAERLPPGHYRDTGEAHAPM
jgi:hypothetical protein